MIDAAETFDGTWPYTPMFGEAAGFRQHYIDEGKGNPIICLHGEPTWGYLYRNMIGPLAAHHRVVVPDHMGFGKSETPQDREYTLRTHVTNLTALIDDLGLDNGMDGDVDGPDNGKEKDNGKNFTIHIRPPRLPGSGVRECDQPLYCPRAGFVDQGK